MIDVSAKNIFKTGGRMILAGIEAGGTKFIVGVAEADQVKRTLNIIAHSRFLTGEPQQTIKDVIKFFNKHFSI